MRWKIKSIDTNIDDKTGKRTRTKTKQLMISVGDLVGVGKNAYNAVQNAIRTVSTFVNGAQQTTTRIKNKGNGEIEKETSTALKDAGLSAVSSSLEILSTVIKGLDIYKGITKAIEVATPIVQTIARASGAWASPGNAGDIAQIILGKVQKILISLAVAGILKLKEIIWNYEFPIKEIKSEFTDYINNNLKYLNKKMPIPSPGIDFDDAYENNKNNKYYDINKDGGFGDGIIDFGDWQLENIFSKEYTTEHIVGNTKRIIRGSLIDKGIHYSDDNGKTWMMSNIENGSWNCFAKIKNNNNYIYVAGGMKYIKELKSVESKIEDTNYFYYDPIIDRVQEYSYGEKENAKLEDLWLPKTFVNSMGIYYSEDNGETWEKATNQSEWINDLCEFEEKQGDDGTIESTITASTNDYEGCLYTTDGINWSKSIDNEDDRWLDINIYDNVWKHIKFDSFDSINYKSYIKTETGKLINNGDLYQKFNMDFMSVEKKKNEE